MAMTAAQKTEAAAVAAELGKVDWQKVFSFFMTTVLPILVDLLKKEPTPAVPPAQT